MFRKLVGMTRLVPPGFGPAPALTMNVQEASGNDKTGSARVGSSALFIYMYPSLMVNRYGPWMDTNMVVPTGKRAHKKHLQYQILVMKQKYYWRAPKGRA